MKKIAPEKWMPADSLKLEANAMIAITAPGNTLVVAGPGSGKTELLAQKACYLLQTNTCIHPRRILAISFKRDAAFNIKERVSRRCGEKLSQRFDSYTFDKFAKQILDRFRNGLLDPYKLSSSYELLALAKNAKLEIENAFRAADLRYFNTKAVKFEEFLTSRPLPFDTSDLDESILQRAWLALTTQSTPKVDFKMIMRFAQYIMASNPKLRAYLLQTYSHVFLDEFQDTTFLQYDLLRVCFSDSQVNYTAVGDDKQTIMKWAGAIPDIFQRYLADTGATRLPLTMNFRSAPRLVNLQNYLVENLLKKTDFAQSSPKWKGGEGEARMCFFDNQAAEIKYLLVQIHHWINEDHIPPREICILVKQTPPQYTQALVEGLIAIGIQARDESSLQDLLCEEVAIYVINVLMVIFSRSFGQQSDDAFDFLCNINSSYDDLPLLRLKMKYIQFCERQRGKFPDGTISDDALAHLIVDIVKFAGIPKIKLAFSQYQQGNWLKKVLEDLFKNLKAYYGQTKDIVRALEALLGCDSIPVMTTHKSKGLEYHTVIFIGLEDKAFWTYQSQKESDDNLVFVAFSRAKERVLFTFCSHRNQPQYAKSIEVIHNLLILSPDVTMIDLRSEDE